MARRSFAIPEALLAGAKVTTVNAAALDAAPTPDNSTTLHVQVNPRRQEVVLPPGYVPPTLNRLMRGKVGDRIRLGRACRRVVGAACRAAGVRAAPGKRRLSLVVTFAPGRKMPDVDALYKCLLDSLVVAGAIRGDRYEDVELAPVRFLRDRETRTTIILEDMPG